MNQQFDDQFRAPVRINKIYMLPKHIVEIIKSLGFISLCFMKGVNSRNKNCIRKGRQKPIHNYHLKQPVVLKIYFEKVLTHPSGQG